MGRSKTSKNRATNAKDIEAEASSERVATYNVQSYILEQLIPSLLVMQQIEQ